MELISFQFRGYNYFNKLVKFNIPLPKHYTLFSFVKGKILSYNKKNNWQK